MQWTPSFDDKFCIAILGDFLGGGSDSFAGEGVTWTPTRATPDSVMKLAGFRPRIRVSSSTGEEGGEVLFDSFQSFDPGELFKELHLFGPLREAREAAKSGQPLPDHSPETTPEASEPVPKASEPVPAADSGLLDAILDVSQPQAVEPAPGTPEEIEAFVREVVRPHLVRDDSDKKSRIAAVDEATSHQVSAFLHSASFQHLEAIWCSIVFLLSHIDTTGKVRVHLVQLPKEELDKELAQGAGSDRNNLLELLSSPPVGTPDQRWGLVLGAYDFGMNTGDMDLLGRIAQVARAADVPWISGITLSGEEAPPTDGQGPGSLLPTFPEDWQRLRERPEAAWLGLTHPRFLLREPFGEPPRRTRVFDFQESVHSSEDLLWGDGSFLAAALLAQGVVAEGWGVRPENHLDLGEIPLSSPSQDRGSPPTSVEGPLSPGDARALMETGIMPLLGFPERAAIRIGGIHSVADSTSPLAAWWKG
jgi:hypothetical protein